MSIPESYIIDHWLPCTPPTATAQQKGVRVIRKGGKFMPMFYTKKKVQQASNTYAMILSTIRPKEPFIGPLALTVEFVFPWLVSESKWNRANLQRRPKATASDCSNLIKELEDVMTRLGFWKTDGQIADLRVSKWHGAQPGIRIKIATLRAVDSEKDL